MTDKYNLERFVTAQEQDYKTALAEVSGGRKRSHWMWYIFPQIKGLGFSDTARFYAIKDLQEAADYLSHPILGARLMEICGALLGHKDTSASQIFGNPDDLKLRSSMTLFAEVEGADPIFAKVLERFYSSRKDERTIAILDR